MPAVPRSLCLLATLLPGLALAGTVSPVWPGAAPCNTTLQACVDATPDGSVISIVTNTPIAENINLYNRSLSLVAGPGWRPNFASGRWISVTSAAILGNQSVTLRGLRLHNSYVNASYGGLGTARFDFSGLVLTQDSTAPTYLRVEARNGSTVEARIYDNRVTAQPAHINAGLIELVGNASTLNADVYYNQIDNRSVAATDGAGIFVDVVAGGAGRQKMHGNRVRGGFFRGGIFVSEGLFSSATSSFEARVYSNAVICAEVASSGSTGSGIGFTVNNGSISAQALNNTVTRCNFGISATQWSGATGSAAAISGLVKNNIVVGTRGLSFTPALTPSLSNDYNLLNAGSNTATLGANTITADARLVSLAAPRLRADSPAVDSADGAALGLGLIFNGLPTTDADGLRRFKGAAGDADIGAYEYGDRNLLHVARSSNINGHITRIDNALLDGQSAANPIATPHWNGSGAGVPNDAVPGIYYAGDKWRLFNEDVSVNMPLNAAYNAFLPAAGSGSFRHVSSAANVAGFVTRLDNGSVNGLPERIVLVTQNWSAGSNVYNPHPIGVRYMPSGSSGNWQIVNIDLVGAGMPLNAGFNVYAQEASPNAFRASAIAAGSSIVLDHVLLNDISCAQPQVTRLYDGGSVLRNFDVYYGIGDGRWRIFSYSALTPGDQFNVLIDPAQVFDCTDRIFANGLQ